MRELTFEAYSQSELLTLILGAAVALFAGLAMAWLLKRKKGDRNRRLTGAMVLFFVFILGLGTAIFSQWNLKKLSPVRLLEKEIQTPYGSMLYAEITDAYLTTDRPMAPTLGRKEQKNLLVIEGRDRVHVLSEANFQVEEIFEALKTRMNTR